MVAPTVRLLGEVHLWDPAGGGRLDLGPHGRRLLAVLGLHRARRVPSEQLAVVLWGEGAEPGPTALRMAVSRLRRRLEDVGLPDAIDARGGAYRLDVPAAAIDAGRFLEAVRSAERLASTQPDRAVALLEDARLLWEGEPLGSLGVEPWAIAYCARLAEARLDAEDLWATLQLAAGRERAILEELTAAVQAAPYRELRWVRLASALSRVGRQVDALRAIDRARRLLREDLGLDPGPELRETEQVLLSGSTPGIPAALPVDPPATPLLGRADDLDRIRLLLVEHRVVSLVGPGGVGKTALARSVGEAAVARGQRVCEVPLDGRPGVYEVRLGIAERAGIVGTGAEAADLPSAIAARLQAFDLLVLDGAEAGAEAVAEVVDGLALLAPSLRVLVTTREPIHALREVRFDVLPLAVGTVDEPGPAVALFVARAGLDPDGLSQEELEEAVAICARAGGLPLAVELAAIGATLGSASGRETWAVGERALDRAFDTAVGSLSPEALVLLARAARLPDGMSLPAAAAVTGTSVAEARVLLGRLAALHLVAVTAVRSHGPRYCPPPSVRRAAVDRIGPGTDHDAAVVGYLTELARSAGDFVHIPVLEAVPAVEEELGNLRHWLDRLVGTRAGFDLAVAMTTAWSQLGLGGEGVAWLRRHRAALPDPREADDVVSTTAITRLQGYMTADFDAAALRRDMEVAERLGLWWHWFHLRGCLVLALARTGSIDEAMELILRHEVFELVAEHGDEWIDLQRQEMLALGPSAFGDPGLAYELTEGFPERYLALGDRAAAIRAHYHRGWIAGMAGLLDEARVQLHAAIDLAYDGFPREEVAKARAELAVVARRQGDPGAGALLRQAVDALDRTGNSRAAAVYRRDLAELELGAGRRAEARALLRAALPVLLRTDRPQAAAVLADLATALEEEDATAAARLAGAARRVCGSGQHPLGSAPEVELARQVAQRFALAHPEAMAEGEELDDDALLEEALRAP